jgi:hypothetical protein
MVGLSACEGALLLALVDESGADAANKKMRQTTRHEIRTREKREVYIDFPPLYDQ